MDDDGSHIFEPGVTVTIRDDDPGATIWYRLDGGEPGPNTTPASTQIASGGHTPAINDAAHEHLRAKAFHGGIASSTTSLDLVLTSPRLAIDTPGPDQYVLSPANLALAGWALDFMAPSGPGVDAVHVYAYPSSCSGSATFLGVATYGSARADVGAAFGSQFTNSGYSLGLNGLADGTWCLVPFEHSAVSGRFTAPHSVILHVNEHLASLTFDPPAGAYDHPVSVTIGPSSPLPAGTTISYTTDGGSTWQTYTGTPVAIGPATTLRAVAHLDGAVDSTLEGTYTLTLQAWTVRYYHVDALGSVRLVTDANGAMVERHDFLPFGDESLSVPPMGTPTFTGQERDVETKLDYFGARYLLPLSGRFMTPDPLKTDAALVNPQMWNRYAYVLNNPATLVDPSGMETCPPEYRNDPPRTYRSCTMEPEPIDWHPELRGYGTGDEGGFIGQSRPLQIPPDEIPPNPCTYMGAAMPPSSYAAFGKAASNNPFTTTKDLSSGFRIGGYLDAQRTANGNVFQRAAYGNYAYGVYMAAAGFPLSITLAGADGIAAIHKNSYPTQYSKRTMDPFWSFLPAANVVNIKLGYMAYRSGSLCHQ